MRNATTPFSVGVHIQATQTRIVHACTRGCRVTKCGPLHIYARTARKMQNHAITRRVIFVCCTNCAGLCQRVRNLRQTSACLRCESIFCENQESAQETVVRCRTNTVYILFL